MKNLLFAFLSLLLLSTGSLAQTEKIITDSEWCKEKNNWGSEKKRHCEVREITLDTRSKLSVDGGKNGGISIKGWDKNEIQILAQVSVYTRKRGDAKEIVDDVSISTRSTIKADVPKLGNRESVSVSYRIYVPNNIDLNLEAYNGGISLKNINGDLDFETLNGGITLSNLGGKVNGETTNGGIKVELTGSEWIGDELDVETTNGGIVFYIPENYNAMLETGTVNGSLDLDFPVTVSGRIDRDLKITLGKGGNLVRVKTVNSGVKLKNYSGKLSSL